MSRYLVLMMSLATRHDYGTYKTAQFIPYPEWRLR